MPGAIELKVGNEKISKNTGPVNTTAQLTYNNCTFYTTAETQPKQEYERGYKLGYKLGYNEGYKKGIEKKGENALIVNKEAITSNQVVAANAVGVLCSLLPMYPMLPGVIKTIVELMALMNLSLK